MDCVVKRNKCVRTYLWIRGIVVVAVSISNHGIRDSLDLICICMHLDPKTATPTATFKSACKFLYRSSQE